MKRSLFRAFIDSGANISFGRWLDAGCHEGDPATGRQRALEEEAAQRARTIQSLELLPRIRDDRGLWLDEGEVVDGQRVIPPELLVVSPVPAPIPEGL